MITQVSDMPNSSLLDMPEKEFIGLYKKAKVLEKVIKSIGIVLTSRYKLGIMSSVEKQLIRVNITWKPNMLDTLLKDPRFAEVMLIKPANARHLMSEEEQEMYLNKKVINKLIIKEVENDKS